MKFWKTILLLAAAIVGIVYLYRFVRYVKMARYPVHGIDVSRYQGNVDWPVIARNYQFVFLKATEGTTLKDRYFKQHWQRLGTLSLKRGAYHFFLPAQDATLQAKYFIRQVSLKRGDLPPVLDVEITQHLPSATLVSRIKQWMEMIEGHYGVKPLIYTNQAFYRQHLQGKLTGYPIWIARYSFVTPKSTPNWHFWQYSDQGQVNGITGKVDLNVFYGSLSDLDRICLQ